jgi:HD-like signal output (HDOD) protein
MREEALAHPGIVVPAPARAPRGQPQHPGLNTIAEGLKNRTIEVPAVPAVVGDLRKAIAGQKSSLDDVARLIQRDQSLALDVLKIANSAVYARGARTSDLKTAVGRIGLVQLEGLIEMVFLRDCYQPRVPLFKSLLAEIWRYSVGMALAMRILADGMSGPSHLDGGVAYAAGLLSDVGASYLLWLISERAPDLEIDVFLPFVRDRHEAIGGQILAAMSLDPAIAQVGTHHHAQSPPMGVSLYWSLAAVASELCDRAVPRGDITRNVRRGVAFVGQSADALRITEVAMRKAADHLDDELHGILEALC